ncbi:hypothetical protein ACIBO2_24360 [Nonomuraea sp. NPDC050022]|uniref:hypothetical protein n=1 Tax=Nonomuraea sp. NPDC050022 TaxID=3364358 RepID=UPI0037AF1689
MVTNNAGKLLMRRSDNGNSGGHVLGESIPQATSVPSSSTPEVPQEISRVHTAQAVSSRPIPSTESREVL